MRMVLAALMMALVLALGVLEVLASRIPAGYDRPDHPDAFAIWHAR